MVWDGTNIEINGNITSWSMYVDLKDMRTNYNAGTTESVANIIDNSIHVVAYTSSQDLAPLINYNARLRFVG